MSNLIPEALSDMNRLSDMASLSSSYSSTDTDLYISLINSASRYILSLLRYDSLKYKTVDKELHNGYGSNYLFTNYYPIIQVNSLYSDSQGKFPAATLIDTDNYFIENSEAGIIRLTSGHFTNSLKSIQVSYIAGYSLLYINNYNLVFNEGGSDLTAVISSGKYNPVDLATEIETQLNTVGSNTYTVEYSEITHLFTFSATTTFTLKWTSSQNLAYVIGVDYTGDYTGSDTYNTDYPVLNIPEDIILACNQLVRWLHSEIIENRAGKFSDGDYSFDFSNIPEYILEIIRTYRRIL